MQADDLCNGVMYIPLLCHSPLPGGTAIEQCCLHAGTVKTAVSPLPAHLPSTACLALGTHTLKHASGLNTLGPGCLLALTQPREHGLEVKI